ncbi:hypothetical protein FACS1894216_16420 [Synergistales bacterium]|nr:hypothetical protein FACS1894216_16420 [Synergistales bacterium]
MTFGARLKSFRTEKHITQSDLAEKIGVHEVTLRGWENNKDEEQGPALPILLKLCSELNVSLPTLAGINEEPSDNGTQTDFDETIFHTHNHSEFLYSSKEKTGTHGQSIPLESDDEVIYTSLRGGVAYRFMRDGGILELIFSKHTPFDEREEMIERSLRKTFGEGFVK